jgi:hypothetical protein
MCAAARRIWLGGTEGQRHGSATGVFGVINSDRASQLFSGVLHLPEIVGEGAIEIDTGIADADRGAVPISGRFDVDAFVLGAADGAVQEVPENESQEILVGAQFEIAVNLVDNYCLSAHGAGEKTRHQFVHKSMEQYRGIQISSH